MRVLWVACLLFGSISCPPVGKDSGSNYAYYPGYSAGGYQQAFDPSSSSTSSASLLKQPQPGSHKYEFPVPQYAPSSSGYSGYGGSANAYPGYGYYAAEESNVGSGSATNYGGEQPEPVFSDVSDLEPVYSFSSRSRYQRGRAVYAESRYTPLEPVYPAVPAPRYVSRSTSQGGSAADPAKGIY